MQDITRNSYSLYKRESGNRTIWYVRFWDDELQSYTAGRSTGQTTKAAAQRIAQKWLYEGLPQKKEKSGTASKTRILSAIVTYLRNTGAIVADERIDAPQAIRMFYADATNEQFATEETFVDYLYRFWDWDSTYVQGRIERGRTISKGYVNDCRSRIQLHIAPYFKDLKLYDVTPQRLEEFIQSIPRRDADPQNGYSRRTINALLKTIKVALKDAVRLEILQKNPADKIDLLAEDTRQRGILTPQELTELFALEWIDERGKIASILAAVSGMRLSEIVALQREDIDVARNIIHVRHSYSAEENRLKTPKNGKTRIVYTDNSIIAMLIALYDKNPHDGSFIFWGLEPDKPIRIESIERHLEKALCVLLGKKCVQELAGEKRIEFDALEPRKQIEMQMKLGELSRKSENISFHGFRHFFNSTIRGTVSDDILRLQTGHLTAKMTDAYDHITDERGEQLRKAVQDKILPFIRPVA
jgi:integrase